MVKRLLRIVCATAAVAGLALAANATPQKWSALVVTDDPAGQIVFVRRYSPPVDRDTAVSEAMAGMAGQS